jgi:hypothetical protein
MPWFVMAIRWSAEDALQHFLISNDQDLLSALRSIQGRGTLEFLACCRPEPGSSGFGWSMTSILEVWLGDELRHDSPHAVFVDHEHRLLAGSSFEHAPGISRSSLVARVGEVV